MENNYPNRKMYLNNSRLIDMVKFSLALMITLGSGLMFGQTLQTTTINASGNFSVPTGVTQINVQAWGGGGGGGGSNGYSNGGSGGGAGGYLSINNLAVTPAVTHAIVVGANGDGFSNANGTAGEASTITSLGLSANGGSFGRRNGGAAGVGGTATGPLGTTTANGGNGLPGGNSPGGRGGDAPSGGAGGLGGNGANGANGAVPGGGGGGGESNIFSSNYKGGSGGKGRVIISYYIAPTFTSFSPNNACAGTVITINGTNFIGINTITFSNGVAVSPITVTATQITFRVPLGAASGIIRISRPSGFVDTTSFTVNASSAIAAITGSANVCLSGTSTLSHVNAGGSWSSSTPGIATINASTGVVTGISLGSTTITYTVNVGGCISTTTKSITVSAPPVITVPVVACLPQTGAPLLVGPDASIGTWSSTNSSVASVSNSGNLILAGAGTATLTFTNNTTGCSAAATIQVYNPLSVSTQPIQQSVCVGSPASFSIVASGSVATYRWYRSGNLLSNGGSISGANTATLTISAATLSDQGNYWCEIVDFCGTAVSSNAALLTVTQPVSITTQPLLAQTVCSGNIAAFTVVANGNGLSYQWYQGADLINNTGAFSGADTATLTINPVTPLHAASNYHVVVSGSLPCNPVTSSNAALIVDEVPTFSAQPAVMQTVCVGASATLSVTTVGNIAAYKWYKGATPLTNGTSISGSNTATLTINPITLSDGGSDYHCIISNACVTNLSSAYAQIIVNEKPDIETQNTLACSGTAFSFSPANGFPTASTIVPANTMYSWNMPTVTGGLTGGVAGVNQTNISGLFFNPTNVAQTATYIVTPVSGTAGNCTGTAFTLIVTVKPAPSILNFNTQTCSGVNFNVTPPNSADNIIPPGTTYSWGLPTVEAGLSGATTGSGMPSISQILVNSTNTIKYATYTITAAYGGCDESSFNLTVGINPKPTVGASILSQSACSGLPFTPITLNNPNTISGTYSWALQPNANISGPSSGGSNTISGSITNLSNVPQTATYLVYYISDGSCSSDPLSITINVNPIPVPVATPMTQAICSGNNLNIAVSTSNNVVGTTYSWIRSNTNITGIPMSGTLNNVNGYTISGVVSNSTNTTQNETFSIIAMYNGCSSTINNVLLTVNPKPSIAMTPATQTLCGSLPISSIYISNPNNVSATTYSWVRNNTANVTGIANSGTGDMITGTLINITNINQTVQFTATAAAGTCSSSISIAEVIVKPAPLMTPSPAAQTICSGATGNITFNNTNSMAGIVYSWSRTNTTGITGTASGSTNVVNGLFTNTLTTVQTTTITMVATAGGCSTSTTATITVYPPVVAPTIGANQVICVNQTPTPIVMTSIPAGGSSSFTYQWQSSLTGAAGSFINIAGATGTTYQPPQTSNTTPTTHYQVVVTGCGVVTSNSVSVVVANDQNFSIDIDNGSGTFCPGDSFTPYIFSINAPWVRLYYSYTGDGNYISPAIGPQTGGYTNLFLVALSYANLSMTVENNTNANVTTNVFITPHVYNYFTGQFICSLSPERVTITIRPRPKVTISNVPSAAICSATPAGITLTGNLSAANTTFNWVRVAPYNGVTSSQGNGTVSVSGQNPFTIPDVLTNTTNSVQTVTYSVTPKSPNCNGTPTTVTFTVNPQLVPGTINSNQTICSGGNPAELTVTGTVFGGTATYQWQSSPTGAVGSWTNITNAINATYDPPVLTTTTYYRRIITSNVNGVFCSVANTTAVVITINNVTAGQIAGTQTICNNTVPAGFTNVVLGTGTALTYQWEYSTEGCDSGWNIITGATLATYTVLNPLTVTTYYRRIAKSTLNGVCTMDSNCIVVTVNQVTGGAIASNQTICGNDPDTITETLASTAAGTITYRWESTPIANCGNPNSGWVTISGAISNTYNPPAGLLANTCFRRITISTLGSSICTTASNPVTVTIDTATAGTVGPNRTVCSGGDPAIFNAGSAATGSNIQYQWEYSTVNPTTGPWTPISGATAQYYDASAPISVTTYFRRKATSDYNAGNCPVYSGSLTVFVNDVTTPVIAGSQTICGYENPAAFSITTNATGTGTLSYQWQSSLTGSAPWTNIGSSSASPALDLSTVLVTTHYQLIATSTLGSPAVQCSATSNTIIITNNTKRWTGALTAEWENPGNWTPNGVPTDQHCVVIPNTTRKPTIAATNYIGYAKNLTVENGGRLDVYSRNTLVVTNFVNVNPGGIFDVRDSASLVQIDDVDNTGTLVMQRITQPMHRYDYTYWNSPLVLDNYKLGDLSQNLTQPDKYYSWNPSIANGYGNWVQESAATKMDPTKGYIIRAPNTFDTNPASTQNYTATFTGTPNNGDIMMPIKVGTMVGTTDDKMNLIGNPYPSAISANLFLNHPDNVPLMEGILYFWTHHAPPSTEFSDPFYNTFILNYSADGYATYSPGMNGGTTTVPSSYGGEQPVGYIAAGQSVFVIGKTNGNATFNNGMRVAGSNNIFFKNGNKYVETPEEIERHRIWLNLAGTQGKFSQILAGYADGATNGIDRNFDGEAMSSNPVVLYSLNSGKKLGIQGRTLPFDVNDQIPLGYNAATAGTLTLGIDHLDGAFESNHVYLEDKLLNIIHDLKVASYTFSTAVGTFDNRFVLRYTNNMLGVNDPHEAVGLTAFIKNGKLFVEAGDTIETIAIYDISGKHIRDYASSVSSNNFEGEFAFAQGVYLAKIKLANGLLVTSKLSNGN